MVPLLFSHGTDPVNKLQSLLEVRKPEIPLNLTLVHHFPVGNARMQLFKLRAMERRSAAATGDAFFVSQLVSHSVRYLSSVESGVCISAAAGLRFHFAPVYNVILRTVSASIRG